MQHNLPPKQPLWKGSAMCKDCNYTIHGAQHHFG